jgi:hypothetical protein
MKKVNPIGGTLLALPVAGVVAIAVWPASETDKARDNGGQVGQAVNDLADISNLDDLTDDASVFHAPGPAVHQAFWAGFQSTVSS